MSPVPALKPFLARTFCAADPELARAHEAARVEKHERVLDAPEARPAEVARAAKALFLGSPSPEKGEALVARATQNSPTAGALAKKSVMKVLVKMSRNGPKAEQTTARLDLAEACQAVADTGHRASHYASRVVTIHRKVDDPSTLDLRQNARAAEIGLRLHREDPHARGSGYANAVEHLRQAVKLPSPEARIDEVVAALAHLRDRVVPNPFQFRHTPTDLKLLSALGEVGQRFGPAEDRAPPNEVGQRSRPTLRGTLAETYAALISKACAPSSEEALPLEVKADALRVLTQLHEHQDPAPREALEEALEALKRPDRGRGDWMRSYP